MLIKIYKFLVMGLVMVLAGCGTQGGSSGDSGTGSTEVVSAIQLTAASSSIGTGQSTTITATLFQNSGKQISESQTMTFSLSSPGLGTITSPVTFTGGSVNRTFTARSTEGSVTITATVGDVTKDITIQISDEVAAASVTPSPNPANITVGGTSVVSATVLDISGDPMPDGTTVNFTVDNSELGSIVATAKTTGGVALATFSAGEETTGTATITATSGSISGTSQIVVAGAAAGSIIFDSASPQVIVIKTAGGTKDSIIKFLVKDSNGNPVSGSQTVRLTLERSNAETPNGGEYLGSTPGTTTVEVGTVSGFATTTLHSGTTPGTVQVNAVVVENTELSSSSGVIAIGGGIPSAKHFDLSATTLNLEGLAYSNIQSIINVLIADRYGNKELLEGTAVSFQVECGAIDRSVNLDSIGSGSVVFRTQDPSPQDVSMNAYEQALQTAYFNLFGETFSDANNPRDGVCTIIGMFDGEEEFTDANANGDYDPGETFVDSYDDVFIDKDDDPMDVPFGTEFVGYPFDPTFEDLVVDANGNGLFNGMSGDWDGNKRIWEPIDLLMTGIPTVSISTSSVTVADGGRETVTFCVHDVNWNPPIAGTTFEVSLADVSGGGIAGQTKSTFLDTNVYGAPTYSVDILDSKAGDTDPPSIGSLTITVKWKGAEYIYSIPVSVD